MMGDVGRGAPTDVGSMTVAEYSPDDRRIETGDIESNSATQVSRSSCEDGAIICGSTEDDDEDDDDGRDSMVGEARVICAS